ncbi:MAG: hypothetical protein DWQ58_02460 [Microcystis aeruginosa TA09]|nr:MAG: hypothetical protein DWQ58_02460 [Microcystis aeruginosa TA09]
MTDNCLLKFQFFLNTTLRQSLRYYVPRQSLGTRDRCGALRRIVRFKFKQRLSPSNAPYVLL